MLKARIVILTLKLRGYDFRIAKTREELDAVSALKFKVYSAEGYIDPRLHPDMRLNDVYDDHSVNIGGYWKGRLVGTVRLILDSERSFPTENLFNIGRLKERARTAEIGRLVIEPDFRKNNTGRRRYIMFGMAYTMLHYCLRHGIIYWITNMPEKLALSYQQFGAFFVRIPEQPPTPANLSSRSIIAGYFSKRTLLPYFLDVNTIFSHSFRLKKKAT